MRYKFSLIVLFFSILIFNCYAQHSIKDSLTLNEAVKLSLANQPLLEQALEQINAAEAKINQQNTYYYPKVEGELNYTRIGPIPSIDFGGLSFKLAPSNNYDAHVSASELIYDFGKRNALIDLARSNKLSSEDKITLIKNNLSFQTIQTFYTILFLRKSKDVENEQINTLQQHIDITEKKVQSGSATDFDVLTTQVKVADAKNRKIDIENSLRKEEINLRSLLGLPSNEKLNLSGEFLIDTSAVDIDSLITEALKDRAEMKLAKDAEKSAMISKHVASLSDKPTLSLMASYGFKNGYEPNLDVLRGNWAAGLNASIPIFNGNLKDAKIEEADANLKASSAGTSEVERNIKKEIEQAAADYEANKLKIETSDLQVKQANQAVLRAELKYRDGVITNLDLIDAETSLAQAKLIYLQVIYKSVLSYYNLQMAAGKLLNNKSYF